MPGRCRTQKRDPKRNSKGTPKGTQKEPKKGPEKPPKGIKMRPQKGPKLAPNGPKKGPQRDPTNDPNWLQMDPKRDPEKGAHLGPKLAPTGPRNPRIRLKRGWQITGSVLKGGVRLHGFCIFSSQLLRAACDHGRQYDETQSLRINATHVR